MFSEACQWAYTFTRPVIISTRHQDGTVGSGCAAFVVVNDEGWVITVAHLWENYFKMKQDLDYVSKYKQQVQDIASDQTLSLKAKNKKIGRLKTDKKWITHNSFWWDGDGVNIKDVKLLPEGDLAVGQLDPFSPKQITRYPVFKNPANIKTGTSLCKLGFPFHEIKTTFDDAKGFRLEEGSLPVPFFPIEGIYTRDVVYGKSRDDRYVLKYLETSTPGLRGQSGGPTFDAKGIIWAIQSRTEHLPLGFTPVINKDSKPVEEHQFLNAGRGVHPELITAFLIDNGINFNMSDY